MNPDWLDQYHVALRPGMTPYRRKVIEDIEEGLRVELEYSDFIQEWRRAEEAAEPPRAYRRQTRESVPEGPISVQVTDERIALRDDQGEIIAWEKDAWVADPDVVPSIVTALQIGHLEGAAVLREVLVGRAVAASG